MNRVSGPRLLVALAGRGSAACSPPVVRALPRLPVKPAARPRLPVRVRARRRAHPQVQLPAARPSAYRFAVVLPTISINILNDIYEGTKAKAAEIGNIEIVQTGTA